MEGKSLEDTVNTVQNRQTYIGKQHPAQDDVSFEQIFYILKFLAHNES